MIINVLPRFLMNHGVYYT